MGFSSVLGQPTAILTLSRALQTGRVHHAYRFQGPDGVGKEMAALRLAQALVCTTGDPLGCEKCSACRRAVSLSESEPRVPGHPDVVLIERGLYPSSLIGASEATGISVDQIRTILLPRVGLAPHEGRALCIIVRRAEELTLAAANALLKTLEEPPPATYFLLVTSQPGRLLDTIRSRTLEVRFNPLDRQTLLTLLDREGLPAVIADQCGGSMSRARTLAEPEARELRDDFVAAADRAVDAAHPAAALDFAGGRPEGRDGLRELLRHLATVYAERARHSDRMDLWATRHGFVLEALTKAERNVSPALVLEALLFRLRTVA